MKILLNKSTFGTGLSQSLNWFCYVIEIAVGQRRANQFLFNFFG